MMGREVGWLRKVEDGRGVRIDEIGDVEERDEMGRGVWMVKKGGGGGWEDDRVSWLRWLRWKVGDGR